MDVKENKSIADDQLLRIDDVSALTTLSKSCINLWVAQGKFVRPANLSATVKVWRMSDLRVWLETVFTSQGGDHE
jgi:predicted DNA-binding transcriptional regulator AlpA